MMTEARLKGLVYEVKCSCDCKDSLRPQLGGCRVFADLQSCGVSRRLVVDISMR
jgi:hypothetical protein